MKQTCGTLLEFVTPVELFNVHKLLFKQLKHCINNIYTYLL